MYIYFASESSLVVSILCVVLLTWVTLGYIVAHHLEPYYEWLVEHEYEGVEKRVAEVRAMKPAKQFLVRFLARQASWHLLFWIEWVAFTFIADSMIDDDECEAKVVKARARAESLAGPEHLPA